jgi:hypothetical protein
MRITLICCLLLLTFTLVRAQESTPEPTNGWTIEQRCVAEPTTPPDDWSFDGTILMTGYAGIHAVSSDFDTPYVVVFFESRTVPVLGENHYLAGYGGVLSPDGMWFAVVDGYTTECVIGCWGVHAEAIHVYSTTQLRESYSMDWSNSYGVGATGFPHPLFWYDDSQLLYESDDLQREMGNRGGNWLINPFTNELTEWNNPIEPHGAYYSPSPDWTHEIFASDSWATEVWLSDGDTTIQLPISTQVEWKPDSSQFVTYTLDENRRLHQLVLFNRNGELAETIFDVSEGAFSRVSGWSSDGRYLTFLATTLHTADTVERRVVDTCLTVNDSQAWSVDNNQLALLAPYESNRFAVQILDLDTWQRHTVAYHGGEIIGWRADD